MTQEEKDAAQKAIDDAAAAEAKAAEDAAAAAVKAAEAEKKRYDALTADEKAAEKKAAEDAAAALKVRADALAASKEVCVAVADCDKEGYVCGAMQLGATLVSAVAIMNLM